MKRILWYSVCGLLVYVLAVALLLPAQNVFAYLQQVAPQWTAAGLEGNIFRGTAHQLRYAENSLGDLEWRWLPSALLRGNFGYAVHLRQDSTDLNGQLALSLQKVLTLTKLQGTLPSQTLSDWLGLPTQPITALLQLDQLDLTLSGPKVQLHKAEGKVIADRVQIQLTSPITLGVLQLQIKTEQNIISAVAQTLNRPNLDDPVSLQAEFILNPDRSYRITGQISPRPNADERLRSLLEQLDPNGSDGVYRVTLQGSL